MKEGCLKPFARMGGGGGSQVSFISKKSGQNLSRRYRLQRGGPDKTSGGAIEEKSFTNTRKGKKEERNVH